MSRDFPRIESPPPEADQPAWGKVGIIAIVGFVVGVAWPRLAGVSLGPNPPSDAPRMPVASATSPKVALAATVPASTGSSGGVMVVPGANGGNEQGVSVGPVDIAKCRDAKGKAPDACDAIPVDAFFTPKLKELAKCPSALGLSGKVQIGFDLDFKSKTLKVQRAKAKLPRTTLDGLTRCVERSINGASFDELAHENARYTIYYDVSFFPPGRPPEEGNEAGKTAGTPLDGKTAKVVKSYQVRDAPQNGSVVGKLPRGAEVKLLEQKEGWYRVEYGDKKQGWLFGGALGL